MEFTPREINRMKTLLAWRQRPSTARTPRKMLVNFVVWMALVIAFGVLTGGAGSPLMYYCLGLATGFPLLGIVLVRQSVSRWQMTEAIVDWQRVEQIVATAERPGV